MLNLRQPVFPAAIVFLVSAAHANQDINPKPAVIPTLRQWTGGQGKLGLSAKSHIVFSKSQSAQLAPIAKTLRADIHDLAGFSPHIVTGGKLQRDDILLEIDPQVETPKSEGYHLGIKSNVVLSGKTATGVFYATRTLLQMLALDKAHRNLPCGEAIDWPDYGERGFMLDVGRKFFDIKYLRDYVKFMAWYKLNDFQLHLNDGAAHDYWGFRLDSPAFPGLASKDGAYTRKQIEDLQDLAAQYHVTITPEIDAPAHARAFTRYMPELGNPKLPKDHLDLANPKSQEFINRIWKEFIPWFRADAVHIGADEYNGGPGSAKYYKAYINATAAFIRTQGKKVRMWGGLKTAGNSDGVDRDIVVSLWYPGYHDPKEAVKDGYNLINTQDGYLYIVPFAGYYYQFLNTPWLYKNWKPSVFDEEKFEDYDPHILGGMFAVWNDKAAYPYTFEDVHELVKPAMPTLGEILWAGHPAFARTYDAFAGDAKTLGDGPSVRIATPSIHQELGDLAFGMKGAASSRETGNFGVQTLFDGRAPTRWIADGKKPEWARVDLGQVKSISKVILRWVPDSQAKHFKVSVSSDGKDWQSVYETEIGKGGTETVRFPSKQARFVRLDCLQRGGSEGNYSLFAFEVYR